MSVAAIGFSPTRESEGEERKQSWQDKECLEALAALANTRGGTLWVGVKDNGDPLEPDGWPDSGNGQKMEAITNKIVSKLGVHPASVTIENVKGKPVLAIQMHRAPAPVSLSGHYYRRVGNSSREVPGEELARFILERTGSSWDGILCSAGIDAIDPKTIDDFKILAKTRLPELRPSDDAETILNNLQLRDTSGRMVRSAVLLFGRKQDTQRLSPTAFVQIGRFKDDTTILDEKQIAGNLFEQLDGVMAALRGYLNVRYDFPDAAENREGIEAMQRVETWEYPYFALREAIANALLHRDYASSGRVLVRVYDDHLLISSPGLLPEGITIADLSNSPHNSRLRNPLLAQAFYLAEIVERWGTGTTRMAQLCAKQGLPAPEFVEERDELWVTFRKQGFISERLRALGLPDRQLKAVLYIEQNGHISNAEYRQVTGVSARTATTELAKLVAIEVLTPTDERGPAVRYKLKSPK